jgi:hypothetical protein
MVYIYIYIYLQWFISFRCQQLHFTAPNVRPDEFDWIWEGGAVAKFKYYPGIRLETEQNHEHLSQESLDPGRDIIDDLSNMRHEPHGISADSVG